MFHLLHHLSAPTPSSWRKHVSSTTYFGVTRHAPVSPPDLRCRAPSKPPLSSQDRITLSTHLHRYEAISRLSMLGKPFFDFITKKQSKFLQLLITLTIMYCQCDAGHCHCHQNPWLTNRQAPNITLLHNLADFALGSCADKSRLGGDSQGAFRPHTSLTSL